MNAKDFLKAMKCNLVIFCLAYSFSLFAIDMPSNQAENAILVDANFGFPIYEKKADERVFPASLTKVATVAFVLEYFSDFLSCTITAKKEQLDIYHPYEKKKMIDTLPPYALETDGTMIHLRTGEKMTLLQLLEAILIASGNDASNVVAAALCGSIEEFMRNLNHYLKSIGCKGTQFLNPHGLHHPEHYTTARDLALITRRALKNPLFRKIVGKTHFFRPPTQMQKPRTIPVGNRLIKKGSRYYYSKAFGIKTGYTYKAGNCLITAAKDGEKEYIAVLLGYKDPVTRYVDAISLFERVFHIKKEKKEILPAGLLEKQLEIPGAKQQPQGYLKAALQLPALPGQKIDYTLDYELDPISFPIRKNDPLGRVSVFSVDGDLIAVQPIFSGNELKEAFWHRVQKLFANFVTKLALHTNIWALLLLSMLLVIYIVRSRALR